MTQKQKFYDWLNGMGYHLFTLNAQHDYSSHLITEWRECAMCNCILDTYRWLYVNGDMEHPDTSVLWLEWIDLFSPITNEILMTKESTTVFVPAYYLPIYCNSALIKESHMLHWCFLSEDKNNAQNIFTDSIKVSLGNFVKPEKKLGFMEWLSQLKYPSGHLINPPSKGANRMPLGTPYAYELYHVIKNEDWFTDPMGYAQRGGTVNTI